MLLLGSGCLETLAPGSPQSQVFADGEHTRYLGRKSIAELFVMIESQTASQIKCKTIVKRIVEFVLNVCGFSIIACHTSLYSHRCFEIVVTPLKTGTQTVVHGKREDAFRVCHDTALVTLQLLVVREVGIIRCEVSLRVITVGEGDGREIIIVGVTIPIHVECHLISFINTPLTTSSYALVAVLHVIGLHIDSSIFATWTIDTFPVGASLSIELKILHRLVGQTFAHLPVGVAINSHIFGIFYQAFRLTGILDRGVLPTIGVLQLEVGVALQLADRDAQTVMLTQVAITATSGAVFNEQSLVVFLCDDVDYTRNGIGAIKGR